MLAGVLIATPAVAQHDKFVREAKAIAVADLKDPDSAKFRDLFVSRSENGALVLCGEMNAKNSFGAYVGYAPIAVSTDEAENYLIGLHMRLMKMGGSSPEEFAAKYCGNRLAGAK